MTKVFEISGCIEVPEDVTDEVFFNKFIEFIESNGWTFGGGIEETAEN